MLGATRWVRCWLGDLGWEIHSNSAANFAWKIMTVAIIADAGENFQLLMKAKWTNPLLTLLL